MIHYKVQGRALFIDPVKRSLAIDLKAFSEKLETLMRAYAIDRLEATLGFGEYDVVITDDEGEA